MGKVILVVIVGALLFARYGDWASKPPEPAYPDESVALACLDNRVGVYNCLVSHYGKARIRECEQFLELWSGNYDGQVPGFTRCLAEYDMKGKDIFKDPETNALVRFRRH